MVEHDAESQQQPISALGDEVCAADPSPKLSSPDAHMQAFGGEEKETRLSEDDLQSQPALTYLHLPSPSYRLTIG